MLRSTLGAVLVLTSALGCSNKPAPAAGDPPAPSATATAPAAAPTPPAATSDAPKRSAIDCAAVLSGSADHGAAYQPGWGALPAELQALPPGAELCGAGNPGGNKSMIGILVRSPIFGPALGEFYAPIITKMGCTAKPVEIVG